ncbi:DUF2125 domain-containing protein [Roseomonas sp. BN140053]|uniref:DUF2125 domain-containing protein n=1 Tax=Roseomonas sp. BN140053 TaxID=3391898 RepID=UPI0039E7EC2E
MSTHEQAPAGRAETAADGRDAPPLRPAGDRLPARPASATPPATPAGTAPPPRPAGAAPPARRRWRPARLLLGTLVLLVLLAGAHALLWRWMGERLEEGFNAWTLSREAQGWEIEHGPPQRGGWPFAATLRLPNFRLRGGEASLPGGVEWQSTALVLGVVLPRLDALRIEPRGPQRLRLGRLDIPFAADRLVGRLPLQSDVLPRGGELTAERLRVGLSSGNGAGTPGSGLELRSLHASIDTRSTATEGEAAVTLSAQAEEIMLPTLPPGESYPLGPRIGRVGLDAALTGPQPGGRVPATRAAAWRDAGGVLELRGATLQWGDVVATLAATLALDAGLQPMGAGTLRLSGAEAAVAALAGAGLIPQRSAALASRVAAALSRPPAEGGPPQLEIPVTLENRGMSVARIPVARLPALAWPSGP